MCMHIYIIYIYTSLSLSLSFSDVFIHTQKNGMDDAPHRNGARILRRPGGRGNQGTTLGSHQALRRPDDRMTVVPRCAGVAK